MAAQRRVDSWGLEPVVKIRDDAREDVARPTARQRGDRVTTLRTRAELVLG